MAQYKKDYDNMKEHARRLKLAGGALHSDLTSAQRVMEGMGNNLKRHEGADYVVPGMQSYLNTLILNESLLKMELPEPGAPTIVYSIPAIRSPGGVGAPSQSVSRQASLSPAGAPLVPVAAVGTPGQPIVTESYSGL